MSWTTDVWVPPGGAPAPGGHVLPDHGAAYWPAPPFPALASPPRTDRWLVVVLIAMGSIVTIGLCCVFGTLGFSAVIRALGGEHVTFHSPYGYTGEFAGPTWDCTHDGESPTTAIDVRCSIDSRGDHTTVEVYEGGSVTIESTIKNWSRHLAADPEFTGWTLTIVKRADGVRYVLFYGPDHHGITYYNTEISGTRYHYHVDVGSKHNHVPVDRVKHILDNFHME